MPRKAYLFQSVAAAALLLSAASAFAADVTVDLVTKRERLEVNPGRRDTVVTLNGNVPGPVLRFRECAPLHVLLHHAVSAGADQSEFQLG